MATNHYTILTDVGAAKIANAIRLGEKIEVTELAVGDGGGKLPMPGSSATALVNEWRRAPINTSFVDDQNEAWVVFEQVLPPDVGGHYIREIGLYDAAGDLIAIGNYPEQYKPLLAEGASTTQTVRVVIQVLSSSAVTLKVDPSTVLATRSYVDKKLEAHEKSRNHPYATTTLPGMAELATGAEAKNRADKRVVLTPETGGQMLAEHEKAEQAHSADQIVLAETLRLFGGAANVQAVLAMLGDAALKTAGENDGELMAVGAHGWGGKSRSTVTTNMDRLCERCAVYTLAEQYTNGPAGAGSQTYTGQLVVLRREYTAGASVVQVAYINGKNADSGRWERHSDGWDGSRDLPLFGEWRKTASTVDIDSAISSAIGNLGLGSAAKKSASDFASPGSVPGEASYDQATGWSDAGTYLSPRRLVNAFQGSNRSFGSNGYQILPSGMVIQYGTHDVDSYESFPVTFPNRCTSVVLTDYGELNTGNLATYSTTNSGFRIRAEVPNAGLAYYIAIGY